MQVFKFHIPREKLNEYLDPACVFCKRKRSEINKHMNLDGIKVLGGITIIKFDKKTQVICDDCHQIKN